MHYLILLCSIFLLSCDVQQERYQTSETTIKRNTFESAIHKITKNIESDIDLSTRFQSVRLGLVELLEQNSKLISLGDLFKLKQQLSNTLRRSEWQPANSSMYSFDRCKSVGLLAKSINLYDFKYIEDTNTKLSYKFVAFNSSTNQQCSTLLESHIYKIHQSIEVSSTKHHKLTARAAVHVDRTPLNNQLILPNFQSLANKTSGAMLLPLPHFGKIPIASLPTAVTIVPADNNEHPRSGYILNNLQNCTLGQSIAMQLGYTERKPIDCINLIQLNSDWYFKPYLKQIERNRKNKVGVISIATVVTGVAAGVSAGIISITTAGSFSTTYKTFAGITSTAYGVTEVLNFRDLVQSEDISYNQKVAINFSLFLAEIS